jgi:hypothetical protein
MDTRPVVLIPPATPKEIADLRAAFHNNILERDYQDWFALWGMRLISIRRAKQQEFITDAYNEQSSGT